MSALIAWNIADSGGPPWVGWIAGIVAATAVSLAYGRLIAPRLAYSDPIVRAVATLGFALVILGFMELIWGEWPRALRLPTDALGFRVLGVRITYTRVIALALSLAITGGVIVFFNRSRLGLADARAGQRPRNQRSAWRPGPASRRLGLGDLRALSPASAA